LTLIQKKDRDMSRPTLPETTCGKRSRDFRLNWKIGVSQRLESQPSLPENAVAPGVSLHY
jgi:hypothetical protein